MTAAKTIALAVLIIIGGSLALIVVLLMAFFILGVAARIDPFLAFVVLLFGIGVFNATTGRGPRHFT